MTLTECTDRLQQLQSELQAARTAQAMYQSHASEAYALAAEQMRDGPRSAYTAYGVRCKDQARSWGMRSGELMVEIAALESGRASLAAPVVLNAEQCAAVDDTAGLCGVAA